MIYIGIDPGLRGAMALIRPYLTSGGRDIEIWPTPILPGSKKNRDEYDLVEIKSRLKALIQGNGSMSPALFVTFEKTNPMPPKFGGSIANFHRGMGRGFEWMLVALDIPRLAVSPATWQKTMYAGTAGTDGKQRSRLAAERLFPDAFEQLKRTERAKLIDHNLCDALLICEYGRRVHAGRA